MIILAVTIVSKSRLVWWLSGSYSKFFNYYIIIVSMINIVCVSVRVYYWSSAVVFCGSMLSSQLTMNMFRSYRVNVFGWYRFMVSVHTAMSSGHSGLPVLGTLKYLLELVAVDIAPVVASLRSGNCSWSGTWLAPPPELLSKLNSLSDKRSNVL